MDRPVRTVDEAEELVLADPSVDGHRLTEHQRRDAIGRYSSHLATHRTTGRHPHNRELVDAKVFQHCQRIRGHYVVAQKHGVDHVIAVSMAPEVDPEHPVSGGQPPSQWVIDPGAEAVGMQ